MLKIYPLACVLLAFLTNCAPTLPFAKKTTAPTNILHFMYVARDRDLIRDEAFLSNSSFSGAQIMYSWRSLEPTKDEYNFQQIRDDIALLEPHGKKLFIQIQDATFSAEFKSVPRYLVSAEYNNGAVPQCDQKGQVYGWVARRWDMRVRERFQLLVQKLGREFDGVIAGINFQETAIEVEECNSPPHDFSPANYRDSIIENMKVLSASFNISVKMQYANFMPGEWLPSHDEGYLSSVYEQAQKLDIAVGAPDLMPGKIAMVNHAYKLMNEYDGKLVKGIAVQDGNYHGETGSNVIPDGELKSMVPYLYSFAFEELNVSYIFWVKQEPYFSKHVVPFLSNLKKENQ